MKKYKINNFEDDALHPEESLLEAVSPNSRLEKPIKSGFYVFFYFAISLIFIIFAIVGFKIGIADNDYFAKLSARNQLISIPIIPLRGLIYSNDGKILAENRKTFALWLLPSKFEVNNQEKAAALPAILKMPAETFFDLIKTNSSSKIASFLIKEDITKEEKDKVLSLNLSGLVISENNFRIYPDEEVFAHLIGYTSLVNENDLTKDGFYKINDKIGRTGLENYYEKELRGQRGEILTSRFKDEDQIVEPQEGDNLFLNIDSELQRKIYLELENGLKKIGLGVALAVAIDPRDGRVLSLVSLPSFENNSFTKGLTQAEYKQFFENKNQPLLNRAVSGRFPPGSTIKPLIALAALEEKVISPSKKVNAPGFVTITNPYNPEITYTFRDWRNHGWVNMREAIAHSSDIYFYTVGGGFYDIKGLGIEKIAKYLKMFKVDTALGIDL
ncbi:MAG: penicillin-binding transpeptidase domain-containing protein, partial [Patescibacteria group bacterium]